MYTTQPKSIGLTALLLAALVTESLADSAEDQFAVAAAHYEETRWQLAVDEFESFLARYPGHAVAPQAMFHMGEAFVQLGRFESAAGHFRKYLDSESNGSFAADALFRLGETAYFRQQYAIARKNFERFHELYPNDSHAENVLVFLGDIALFEDQALRSQKYFSEALAEFPQGKLVEDSRFGLAQALEKLGHVDAAIQHYHEIVQRQNHPLADNAQLQLALIEYQNRNFYKAEQLLLEFQSGFRESDVRTDGLYWLGLSQRAQQKWDGAADTLSEAVSADARHRLVPNIHFYAGESYRRSGRPRQARAHFDAVLSTWRQSDMADDSLLAKMRMALHDGQLEEVENLAQQFGRSFAHSPLGNNARRVHARALVTGRNYGGAVELFEQWLLEKNGLPDASAWHLFSLAQLGDNQHEAALKSLNEFTAEEENQTLRDGAHVVRASALMGLERFSEAIPSLRAYLDSQPQGIDSAKCQSDLAICLAKTDQISEAGQVWKQLCRQKPEHNMLLPIAHCLAETAYQKGGYKWSHTLFRQLAADGNPPEYVAKGLVGLGRCQLEMNDSGDAARTFEQLLIQNPNSPLAPEAALMRGRALEREEDYDGALAMYHSIIDQYPESELTPDAMFSAARLHDQLQQDQDAHGLLNDLIELHSDYRHLDAVLYSLAWVLMDLKLEDKAVDVFQRIHDEHRGGNYWADATYRYAEQVAVEGNNDQVHELIEQIVVIGCEPDLLGHALYLDGRVYALAEKWKRAVLPLERLVRELPEHEIRIPAEYWIAESFYRQADYDRAGTRFAELSERIGESAQAWMGIIPLRHAQTLAHQKNWDSACDVAAGISDRFPNFRQLYEADYILGRSLAIDGRFEDARAAYQNVVTSPFGGQTETAAMAQWMIGETYFHQNRYDDAIRAYLRVEILYDYPRWCAGALLQAGKCYEMKHSWKDAVQLYARILKEYPNTSFTSQAAQRLRMASRKRGG